MTVVTIPKQLMREKELVLIPRKEYEELLDWKKSSYRVVKPTKAELRTIGKGRKAIAKVDYITLGELKEELGF